MRNPAHSRIVVAVPMKVRVAFVLGDALVG